MMCLPLAEANIGTAIISFRIPSTHDFARAALMQLTVMLQQVGTTVQFR